MSNAEKLIVAELTKPTHEDFFTAAEKKLQGRPYGGNCFLIRKNLLENTEIIYENENILAIQLQIGDLKLIVIGIYLSSYHDKTSIENYTDQLNNLSSIIEMYLDESEILIIGDFQTFPAELYDNLERNNKTRNPLSAHLKLFLQQNKFELVDVTNGYGPTTTYQHKTLPHSSYNDHIALLKESTLSVSPCQVYEHNPMNVSDHQPISICVEYNPTLQEVVDAELQNNNAIPKYAWLDENFVKVYQTEVSNNITTTQFGELAMEASCYEINDLLSKSANKAFEVCFSGKKKCAFSKKWWTPEVTRAKRSLSSHFNVWKDNGFPKDQNNVSYNRFRMARKNFRHSVKNAQNKTIYKHHSDIDRLKDTKPRKFWSYIRKLKNSSTKRSFSINNKQSNDDITNEFADHFNTLLNCPRIEKTGKARDHPNIPTEHFQIYMVDVKEAISSLKINKSPDPFGIVSEHMRFAENEKLNMWLTELYNVMFHDGTTAECLSKSIIIPLVKSYKKSLKSASNYRGI